MREEFRQFVREACDVLADLIRSKKLPDHRAAMMAIFASLERFPSWDRFLRAAADDHDVARWLHPPEPGSNPQGFSTAVFNNLAQPVLLTCLPSAETGGAIDEAFDEAFKALMRRLGSDVIEELLLLPLVGIGLGVPEIALTPSMRIRPVEAVDIKRWEGTSTFNGILRDGLAELKCLIEVVVIHPIGEPPRLRAVSDEDADRLLCLLRLATGHKVAVAFQETITRTGLPFWALVGPFMPFFAAQVSVVDKPMAEKLTLWWSSLKTEPNARRVELPLRRWAQAMERGNPTDSLIDAWVALEALLSPSDRQELGHRVSMRLAYIVGRDAAERVQIYNDAHRSYSRERSVILHGRKPKTNSAAAMLGYTRRLLKRIPGLKNRFKPDDLESRLLKQRYARDLPKRGVVPQPSPTSTVRVPRKPLLPAKKRM